MSDLPDFPIDLQIVSGSPANDEFNISVVNGNDLSPMDRKAWVEIQEGNPELENPFFRLEFVECLARVRPTVKVGILRKGIDVIAFWPYQENTPGIATPVGEKIGCMHGVICRPGTQIDGGDFARLCGLKAWRFDHLLASQKIFTSYAYEEQESPYMDLSGGFNAYRQDRKAKGHSNRMLAELGRKCRRMERELGTLRLEIDCRDISKLDLLVEWKKYQMRETGRPDLFLQSPWILPLLANTIRREEAAFRGMLSVLYLNDEPISIHFGFRSHAYLHGIFFAYNRRYAKYSPGMALVLKLVKEANDAGIARIDMGKGDESYKQMWKSGGTKICVGGIETDPFQAMFRPPAFAMKRKLSRSLLGGPLKRAYAQVKRIADLSTQR